MVTKDLSPDDYFWGYDHMSTVKGLFCAGDASGASSHKFSSGSHAEGRIIGKSSVQYVLDNPDVPNVDNSVVEELKAKILAPMDTYEEHNGETTDPTINPNYIHPDMFMFRLQKIMDEYVGGVSSQFKTSKTNLEKGRNSLIS